MKIMKPNIEITGRTMNIFPYEHVIQHHLTDNVTKVQQYFKKYNIGRYHIAYDKIYNKGLKPSEYEQDWVSIDDVYIYRNIYIRYFGNLLSHHSLSTDKLHRYYERVYSVKKGTASKFIEAVLRDIGIDIPRHILNFEIYCLKIRLIDSRGDTFGDYITLTPRQIFGNTYNKYTEKKKFYIPIY